MTSPEHLEPVQSLNEEAAQAPSADPNKASPAIATIDQGFGVVGLIGLGTALALLLTVGIPIILAPEPVKLSDWLGFAGNVLGSGVALLAAVIAWNAVQRQLSLQREQLLLGVLLREEDRLERQSFDFNGCATYLRRVCDTIEDVPANDMIFSLRQLQLDATAGEIRRIVAAESGTDLASEAVSIAASKIRDLVEAARNMRITSSEQLFLEWRSQSNWIEYPEMTFEQHRERSVEDLKRQLKGLSGAASSLFFRQVAVGKRMAEYRARIEAVLSDVPPVPVKVRAVGPFEHFIRKRRGRDTPDREQ
ncbi:hypothetical protein [Bradyrhizobium oligotrophicum]|uniref:hypothetical protein n=1 Tax=Bradyrhizobium oligotrophicum TaxID=44255 RepID=UPI003EC0B1F9